MDAETNASYEAAGFGTAGSANFGDAPAIVVVDMCAAYFTAVSPLDLQQPSVVEANRRLLDAGRRAGVPIVWTRVEFEPGGENTLWYRRLGVLSVFDRGNPLADWVPGLEPAAGDRVVTKQHASGFFGTDLDAHLRRLGADSVIISGVSTSGCVRATATDASAHGFHPVVVLEAMGDRTAAVHDSNVFDLAAKYADVASLDVTIQHLALP